MVNQINIPSISLLRDAIQDLEEEIDLLDDPKGITKELQRCIRNIRIFSESVESSLIDVSDNIDELNRKVDRMNEHLSSSGKNQRGHTEPRSYSPNSIKERPHFPGDIGKF